MWDKPKEDLLRKLWSQHLTASQISARIPGTTRNSIIGKAHRLNLESRSTSKKIRTKTNRDSNIPPKAKSQKLGRKASFKAIIMDKNFEPENPTKLENLTNDLCRWPLGEKKEPASFFCGRKTMEKFNYCKLHVLWAFQPRNAKEDDQITEEDIPKFIEKKIKSA